MDFNLAPKLVVREAMSSPVISVKENETLNETAKIMRENKVGAIVILANNEEPVGIVTERDIVNRVVAEGIVPFHARSRARRGRAGRRSHRYLRARGPHLSRESV